MVYTINDIKTGDWVLTVYDSGVPLRVTAVSCIADEFQAQNADGSEKWEKLCSDDITKILRDTDGLNQKRRRHEAQKV